MIGIKNVSFERSSVDWDATLVSRPNTVAAEHIRSAVSCLLYRASEVVFSYISSRSRVFIIVHVLKRQSFNLFATNSRIINENPNSWCLHIFVWAKNITDHPTHVVTISRNEIKISTDVGTDPIFTFCILLFLRWKTLSKSRRNMELSKNLKTKEEPN